MLDFQVEDNDAFLQELSGLDDALQQKALNYILGRAVAPIVKRIKQDAPTKTGALKRAMGRKKLNKRERRQQRIAGDQAAVGIGAVRKSYDDVGSVSGGMTKKKRFQDFKLRWFEEGIKAHGLPKKSRVAFFHVPRKRGKAAWQRRMTKVDKRKVNMFKGGGGQVFAGAINHPGVAKDPFMSRNYYAQESQVPDRTMAALKKWMEKNAAKQYH